MSDFKIRKYNKITEKEKRAITLTEDPEDEGVLDLNMDGIGLFVEGIPIILIGKDGPGKYAFKLDQTDKKNLSYFKGFIRHLQYMVTKLVSLKSKSLYRKSLNRASIKGMLRSIVGEKDKISIRLRNTRRKKHREMVARIVESVELKEDEKISTKEQLIRGITVASFMKKYESGTKFTPIYLFDQVICRKRSIEITTGVYELKVEKAAKERRRKIFNYSDSGEESDQEYAYEEPKEVPKVEPKAEKKEEPKVETKKKEPESEGEEETDEEEGEDSSSGEEETDDEGYDGTDF